MAKSRRSAETQGLSFLDAAEEVLGRARTPLTASEIVARAQTQKLLKSQGKTPDQTMASALYMDIRKGGRTRFLRLSRKGPTRAARNSVRWTLKKPRLQDPG